MTNWQILHCCLLLSTKLKSTQCLWPPTLKSRPRKKKTKMWVICVSFFLVRFTSHVWLTTTSPSPGKATAHSPSPSIATAPHAVATGTPAVATAALPANSKNTTTLLGDRLFSSLKWLFFGYVELVQWAVDKIDGAFFQDSLKLNPEMARIMDWSGLERSRAENYQGCSAPLWIGARCSDPTVQWPMNCSAICSVKMKQTMSETNMYFGLK